MDCSMCYPKKALILRCVHSFIKHYEISSILFLPPSGLVQIPLNNSGFINKGVNERFSTTTQLCENVGLS